MRPIKECVGLHVQHHRQKPGSIMVGSQIEDLKAKLSDIQKYKGYLTRLWERPLAQIDEPMNKKSLYLTAANFSISKKVFFDLGGFDERLTDAEDFDLGVKAIQAGIPIYFNSEAIGWHDDLITCKSYIKRQIQYKKAHELLKKLKPDIYQDFDNHQINKINPLKKAFFYFFSFPFWQHTVDNFNWLLIFPHTIRYKIYNYIITARSIYYPEE
jgi:GT2 family glycosyltransferase